MNTNNTNPFDWDEDEKSHEEVKEVKEESSFEPEDLIRISVSGDNVNFNKISFICEENDEYLYVNSHGKIEKLSKKTRITTSSKEVFIVKNTIYIPSDRPKLLERIYGELYNSLHVVKIDKIKKEIEKKEKDIVQLEKHFEEKGYRENFEGSLKRENLFLHLIAEKEEEPKTEDSKKTEDPKKSDGSKKHTKQDPENILQRIRKRFMSS